MDGRERSIIFRLLKAAGLIEDALLVFLLAAMVLVAGAQIVLRNLFDGALLWADPLLRVAVLWVGLIGAMVATRGDKQISIDAVSRLLSSRWKARVRVLTDAFTAVVAGFVAWHAYRLVADDRAFGGLTIASVPLWVCEIIVPIAFGVIAIRYGLYAVIHLKSGFDGEGQP
jgi:TRAP-type C4-dicarboxylate transport system permease small subunit